MLFCASKTYLGINSISMISFSNSGAEMWEIKWWEATCSHQIVGFCARFSYSLVLACDDSVVGQMAGWRRLCWQTHEATLIYLCFCWRQNTWERDFQSGNLHGNPPTHNKDKTHRNIRKYKNPGNSCKSTTPITGIPLPLSVFCRISDLPPLKP